MMAILTINLVFIFDSFVSFILKLIMKYKRRTRCSFRIWSDRYLNKIVWA
jgi:hypothetical protein